MRFWILFILPFIFMMKACILEPKIKSSDQAINILQKRFEHYFLGNVYQVGSALQFSKALMNAKQNGFVDRSELNGAYLCLLQSMGPKDIKQVMYYSRQQLRLNVKQTEYLTSLNHDTRVATSVFCNPIQKNILQQSKYIEQIKGLDLNRDGIRDDVFRRIDRDFAAETDANIFLKKYAKVLQGKLLSDYRNQGVNLKYQEKLDEFGCLTGELKEKISDVYNKNYRKKQNKTQIMSADLYMMMLVDWTYNTHQRRSKIKLSNSTTKHQQSLIGETGQKKPPA